MGTREDHAGHEGAIGDVFKWPRALSAEEVQQVDRVQKQIAALEAELAKARKRIRLWEAVKGGKRSVEALEGALVDAFWERNMIGEKAGDLRQQLATVTAERDTWERIAVAAELREETP